MKIITLPVRQAIAALIMSLGVFVVLGWALGNESMVRILPNSVAMGLGTALLFIAAAICLLPSHQQTKLAALQKMCCWILILLPSAILFEHWNDINLGIDWTSLHSVVKDGNPRPGRTAPNTCLGFLLAGLVFLAYPRANLHKPVQWLISIFTYTVLAIGLTALVGYMLKLEVLYQFATYNRMAAPAAVGMSLIGAGLWLQRRRAVWHQNTASDSPDKRITSTAVAVLTIVALSAGLIGFTVLKQGFEKSMSEAFLRSTKNNAATFSTTINQRLINAATINLRPALQKHLLKLNNKPRDQEALRLVDEVGRSFFPSGVTGIEFFSPRGELLVSVGTMVKQKATMAVPLQWSGQWPGQQAVLLWQDAFVLWTESIVMHAGRPIGKIIVEQRMPVLTKMLHEAKTESASTDILVCGRSHDDAVCFPSRFYQANLHIPMFKDGKPYLAISRALLRQTGVLTVKDLRGIQVLAGYAPIDGLGLGLVLKIDALELYSGIRNRFSLLIGLLIALVTAGTLILRTQVQPLARRVVKDQRRMQVILDSSHEAFVEIDACGIITDWNAEAERTFGWTRQEALGRVMAQTIIPPSLRQGHQQGMNRFLQTGKGSVIGKRVELQALHRSGKEFPIEITISAIKSDDGHSFAAFLHDISDRKEAEIALRESQQRFHTFMNHSPAVAFMKDEDGKMIYANKSFEDVFALRETDWKNKTDAELWPTAVAEDLRLNDLAIFANDQPVTLEECVPTKEGDQVWLTHKFPLRSVSGQRLIGGIAVDITARKQIEATLFSEKERLRVTLNSIGDAVITTDTTGRVSYLNPVAEKMTGWSNHDAYGLPLTTIFHIVNENTGEIAPDPVKHVLLNEQIAGLAEFTTLIQRGGARFPIEDSAAPIRDKENKIIGVVLVFHDVSQARKMAAEMTHQATHDALTGLINRREFERRLELALQTGKQGGKQHTMLYLDLDQFKIINDTCGHVAGDELLRQLTMLLQAKLRQSDTLARLGGDEFGVLLECCGTEPALRIADLLRQTVSDFHFVWLDKVFPIGVSIGLVTFDNGGITLADILRMADAACYVSKDNGRNRIHIYTPQDQELIQRHGEMGWIGRIQKALDEERFVLYSQKIRATQKEREAEDHYELLIRMQDEDGNLVPPMAFIPAAERYGLMPTLDRWVIKTAFAHYDARRSRGDSQHQYAINLSGTSICDAHFLPFIKKQFALYKVPADHICFEITETSAIANLNQAAALIRELKEIGCRFSLDDFGSGMSSFAYLKHLPVDYLKIDGGFVKDMVDDPIDFAMVESIHHIGHVMGIQTIAEFVENDAIFDALQKIGVDFVQGYGIEKPGPLR
jgi:diguanylate cyclase (GGDEF)-like protein/PAS domain S-box-containing protein